MAQKADMLDVEEVDGSVRRMRSYFLGRTARSDAQPVVTGRAMIAAGRRALARGGRG